MRTKIYIGLFVMAIVGIVAGERVFNRLRGAQDTPAKVVAEKKDATPVLPALPPVKDDKSVIPPPSLTTAGTPLSPLKTGEPQELPKPAAIDFKPSAPLKIPDFKPNPPMPLAVSEDKDKPQFPPMKPMPTTGGIPAVTVQTDAQKKDTDPPTVTLPKLDIKKDDSPTFPPLGGTQAVTPPVKPQSVVTEKLMQVQNLVKENKLKEAEVIVKQLRDLEPDNVSVQALARIIETRRLQEEFKEFTPPVKQAESFPGTTTNRLPTVPVPPTTAVAQQLAKLKSSPWSLRVDMIDGQTIISGTVNQKHTFKIACNTLELNTGKDMLKAAGKVSISGDMMTGHCETLNISLLEDRLVLEGGAEVRIDKVSTNVSSTKPASFELKGDTLNLRISDLQPAKLVQTGWQQVTGSTSAIPVRPATTTPASNASWSQWGTLRRMEEKAKTAGESVWRLEDQRGTTILLLVARDGGTLSQYEGRRISVYGANEQIAGESMLRVSHIALP